MVKQILMKWYLDLYLQPCMCCKCVVFITVCCVVFSFAIVCVAQRFRSRRVVLCCVVLFCVVLCSV